ncbi:methylated-DNA--[protein]-cysteine S-methyltransferase, partial [Salmonella enterica subsp. enterica serovar Cerro]|nr:methylated-DNA--[protein]-cysteine S-methyltransferase [Salmonella enterica subsp. enterica serovar Cerro]
MHYGQLAAQLGRPGAARAVGAANGANPISIVVPCHRVIGRNGSCRMAASECFIRPASTVGLIRCISIAIRHFPYNSLRPEAVFLS